MRKRLDHVLVEKEVAPTRSRARDAIQRGLVTVDGKVVDKPGHAVSGSAIISILPGAGLEKVSRGGLKLEAALDHFKFDPSGVSCLDVGASTGGFTEVLLQRGACKVFSVDVGQDQLHSKLRTDPRVISLEQRDARTLTRSDIPQPVSAVVMDVSFISLTKVLPHVLRFTAPGCWLAALIKPQFEVGRSGLGRDGIVRDPDLIQSAVDRVAAWMSEQEGWHVSGTIPSPVAGGSGNVEFLLGAQRDD